MFCILTNAEYKTNKYNTLYERSMILAQAVAGILLESTVTWKQHMNAWLVEACTAYAPKAIHNTKAHALKKRKLASSTSSASKINTRPTASNGTLPDADLDIVSNRVVLGSPERFQVGDSHAAQDTSLDGIVAQLQDESVRRKTLNQNLHTFQNNEKTHCVLPTLNKAR